MKNYEKEVQQSFLDNEASVIKRLKQVYNKSLEDITGKVKELDTSILTLQKALDSIEGDEIGDLAAAVLGKKVDRMTPAEAQETIASMLQSKVYQRNYQQALKKQIDTIYDKMHDEEYTTIAKYLEECYEGGFTGAMYSLNQQGIPLAFPIDQPSLVHAVQLDSKISQGLYERLGEDVSVLKKKITAQVSRGIATGMSYQQVAQQLAGYTNIGFNNAVRIARTEGHRIQCQSAMDVCYKAQEKGADVVKQWDAALDARTRESHAKVDGEVRELDERFSNGLRFPGDPNGQAAEVINCRCALLQRARWALGGASTKMNNFTKQIESFESPEQYGEFKKAFFSRENRNYMKYVETLEERYGTKDFKKLLGQMNDREYNHFQKLAAKNPLYNKKAATAKATYKNIKLNGVDADYSPRITETLDGLISDYPIEGLTVKTHSSDEEFGHFIGGVKSITKNGENYAVYDSEISISRDLHKNKAVSTEAHRATYSNNMSRLENSANADRATLPHEYGHAIDTAYVLAKDDKLRAVAEKYATAQKITEKDIEALTDYNIALAKSDSRLSKEIFDELQAEYGLSYGGTIMRIADEYGTYASSSISEFLAEGFANMRMLDDADKTDFMRSFEKIFNRKFDEVLRG